MRNELRIGDLLYRSKGPFEHAGVYLGGNQVAHTTPASGIEITRIEEYANGEDIKYKKIEETDLSGLASRLSQMLQGDTRFQVLNQNCEQVAYFLISGRKLSPQLRASLIGVIFGGLVGYKTRNENWLALLMVFGLAGCLLNNFFRQYDGVIRCQQAIEIGV